MTTVLAWIVAAVLWGLTAVRLRDLSLVPTLAPAGDAPFRGKRPRVTAIIAARNEERRIERTVRQLLAQAGVELDLVVVDDRSNDRTPAILAGLAGELPRLRVVRVETLPEGWLGKSHACHVGAEIAGGDWLLFVDADVWIAPDVVARAIASAVEERADHFCLFPGESDASLAARAAMITFSAALIHYAARVRRGHPRYFIGVGAFNLVRAEAYRAAGGHEPLRLEVIDDMMLGRRLAEAGFRTRTAVAARDLDIHYGATVKALIGAVEKNLFAMLDFSLAKTLAAIGALLLLVAAATLAPFAGGAAGLAALGGIASAWWPAWITARRHRWGGGAAVLSPLMAPLAAVALAGSAWRTLRDGGVRWRGTFYPLDRLRQARTERFGGRVR